MRAARGPAIPPAPSADLYRTKSADRIRRRIEHVQGELVAVQAVDRSVAVDVRRRLVGQGVRSLIEQVQGQLVAVQAIDNAVAVHIAPTLMTVAVSGVAFIEAACIVRLLTEAPTIEPLPTS